MSGETEAPKKYKAKQTLRRGEKPVLPEGHMIIGRKMRRTMEAQNRRAISMGLKPPHEINLINVKRKP